MARIAMVLVSVVACFMQASAACILPPQYALDTLEPGVVEVTTYYEMGKVVSVDTVAERMLMEELVRQSYQARYVFVGRIDSVVRHDLGPYAGMPLYFTDSVFVTVVEPIKGELPASYWLADTISALMPAKARRESGAQAWGFVSYAALKGMAFLFVGDDPRDLRTWSPRPAEMCAEEPTGYFVDDANRVSKLGASGYGYSSYGWVPLRGVSVSVQDLETRLTETFAVSLSPIMCLVAPCSDINVTSDQTGTTRRVALLTSVDSGQVKVDDNVYKAGYRVRGYFETDSFPGWVHPAEVFVVTEVIPPSGVTEGKLGNNRAAGDPVPRGNSTRVLVDVPGAMIGRAVLYTASGVLVGEQPIVATGPGRQVVEFAGRRLGTGAYFVEIEGLGARAHATKRFTLQ